MDPSVDDIYRIMLPEFKCKCDKQLYLEAPGLWRCCKCGTEYIEKRKGDERTLEEIPEVSEEVKE